MAASYLTSPGGGYTKSMNAIKARRHTGFTIVELLIVIVIIAILASITIVAYNGIQDRAKTSAGQALAREIENKANAWAAIKGVYPTNAQLVAGDASVPEAKLNDGSSVTTFALNSSNANNGKTVNYQGNCSSGGGYVGWYDYTTGVMVQRAMGGATSGTGCN